MTYCILGFCADTGQSGIAYTTVTLAGGGTSPFYSYGGDIIVVQAYGNLATAVAGARALEESDDLDTVVECMAAADDAFEYRQVGIMRRSGQFTARTGSSARPWAGHETGDHHIAMGNVLVGPEVVSNMTQAFEANRSLPLADRLLTALEAGRAAGGQQAPGDQRYDERSALLKIMGASDAQPHVPALDLRIDMQSDAVTALRKAYEIYRPVIARRARRATDPNADLPTSEWEAINMIDNPPPPSLRAG
ncbi:MAG: DUF1028 domain-containing protein [Pseudomonadota bacterium]